MKTKLFLSFLVVALTLAVAPSWACTNLIVGKAASVDGSVICTYNCDGYGFAGSLSRTPGGRHDKGEKIAIREYPMYMATTVLFLVMPLVLASPFSFLIMLLYIPLIAKRIRNEEKVLEEGLEGYKAYKQKVKYKVIPFIW